MTKNEETKRELRRICRKLSICNNEIGPFVVQRERDRIKEKIDSYMNKVDKHIEK